MMSVCFNRSSRATLQVAARTTFQHRPEGLCFARATLQAAERMGLGCLLHFKGLCFARTTLQAAERMGLGCLLHFKGK